MAKRKTNARRNYKRKYKKRVKSKKATGAMAPVTTLSRFSGAGFPDKLLVKHRYCQAIGISASTGTFASFQFSANGMFQPATSGAHQPMYFDQMTALYDHYCVIGSKIRAIASADASGSTTKPAIISLYVNDDTSTNYTSSTGVQEFGNRTRLLAWNAIKPVILNASWSAKKRFSKNPLANDELQGTSSTNPTEQSFYTLGVQDITGAVNVTMDIWIEIQYIAIWKELKDVGQS